MLETTDRLLFPSWRNQILQEQSNDRVTVDKLNLNQLFIHLNRIYVKRIQNLQYSTVEAIAFKEKDGTWYGKSKVVVEQLPNNTEVLIFSAFAEGKVL